MLKIKSLGIIDKYTIGLKTGLKVGCREWYSWVAVPNG